MARTLVLCALILGFMPAAADVSVPIHEAQAYIRTKELFGALNVLTGIRYTGQLTELCDGGPISIEIASVDASSTAWFMETDGRHGIRLRLSLSAQLAFSGHMWGCRINRPVKCASEFSILGALETDYKPRGKCWSETQKALTIDFDLFEVPRLFESGVAVRLPKCEKREDGYACVDWAKPYDNRFIPDPAESRDVRAAVRLFGFSDASRNRPEDINKYPQDLDNLNFNVHVGRRSDLVTTSRTPKQAVTTATFVPSDSSHEFALKLNFNAFNDIYDETGNVIDRGLLGQLLPLYVHGVDSLPLYGEVSYSFFVDQFSFLRASSDEQLYVLELNAYDPIIVKAQKGEPRRGSPIGLFDQLRVRVFVREIRIDDDGFLTLAVDRSEVDVTGLLGLIPLKFKGSFLNGLLTDLFAKLHLAKISRDFDIAIPSCIVAEGKHSKEEIDTCVRPGLLKHTAGIRGIRAKLEQLSVKVLSEEGAIYWSGKMSLQQLEVGR